MANEENTVNLNDAHCQEFIEALAACMVHAAQEGAQPEDTVEEVSTIENRPVQS